MPEIERPTQPDDAALLELQRLFYNIDESAKFLDNLSRSDGKLNNELNLCLHFITKAGQEAEERVEAGIGDVDDEKAVDLGHTARQIQVLGNRPLIFTITSRAASDADLRQDLLLELTEITYDFKPGKASFSNYARQRLRNYYTREWTEPGGVPFSMPRTRRLFARYLRRDELEITQQYGTLTEEQRDQILTKWFGWESDKLAETRNQRARVATLDFDLARPRGYGYTWDSDTPRSQEKVENRLIAQQAIERADLEPEEIELLYDRFGIGRPQMSVLEIAIRKQQTRGAIFAQLERIYAKIRQKNPDLVSAELQPPRSLIVGRDQPIELAQALDFHVARNQLQTIEVDKAVSETVRISLARLFESLSDEIVLILRSAGLDELEVAILYLRCNGLAQTKVAEELNLSQKRVSIFENEALNRFYLACRDQLPPPAVDEPKREIIIAPEETSESEEDDLMAQLSETDINDYNLRPIEKIILICTIRQMDYGEAASSLGISLEVFSTIQGRTFTKIQEQQQQNIDNLGRSIDELEKQREKAINKALAWADAAVRHRTEEEVNQALDAKLEEIDSYYDDEIRKLQD